MLCHLKIENLALLDSVTLEFGRGFTAVTGETGAGKSVLLGALSLLSGIRADKTMIRQGAEVLSVEASLWFEEGKSARIDAFLSGADLPPCEEGTLIIRRQIARSGAPRISINGASTTLGQLQSLGPFWIDFHGPGEPQKLFNEQTQLELLDLYCGNADALESYGGEFAAWRGTLAEIEELRGAEGLDPEMAAFMRQQLREIEALDVSEDSIRELEQSFQRTARMKDFQEWVAAGVAAIEGDEGLLERSARLIPLLDSLAEIDPAVRSLVDRVRSVSIELEDIGSELQALGNEGDLDPEALTALQERMQLWQSLRRKHGGSVASVLAKQESLSAKLEASGSIEERIERLSAVAAKQEKSLRAAAAHLHEKRVSAAKELGAKVEHLLRLLGFKAARLEIGLDATRDLGKTGSTACSIRFMPNRGQALLPLNRIASSGETARVMLALKTALAEADQTPVLVFDEVDANVGGEVGRKVGAELRRLGDRHQVLCVTHLPQVASLARSHFTVIKDMDEHSTTVRIVPLPAAGNERESELARMLGDRESDAALAHARELLDAGETIR